MSNTKSIQEANGRAIHDFFHTREEGTQKKIILDLIFEMALTFIEANSDINMDPEYYKENALSLRSLYNLVNAIEDPGEPSVGG